MGRFGLAVMAAALLACTVESTLASTTTVPTTTTTSAPVDAASASASFRDCMGTAGFEVGDVPIDENGRPDLASLPSNSESVPGFREALTNCAPLLGSFLSLTDSPGLRAMVREQLVLYAQCMRASGVEDFPDPAPGFDGTTSPFPPEQIPLADPEFNTALESCAAAITLSP